VTVTYVHDSDCDPGLRAAAAALNNPAGGVVSFAAQPGSRRDLWLYEAILTALGKTSDDRSRATRARSHAGLYAAAWLQAHNINDIVLYDFVFTNARDLGALCLLAESCGINLTLFADGAHGNSLRNEIDRWADNSAEPADYLLTLTTPEPAVIEVGDVEPFPPVSDSDFPTFRHDTKRLLPARDFDRIDRKYMTILRAAHHHDLRDETVISGLLQDELIGTTDPNEQTTIIRAVQAALFTYGMHADVDVPGVLRVAATHAAVAALTVQQWQVVVSSARPRLPSMVALLAAGVPEDRIGHVPGFAVAEAADTVEDGDHIGVIPDAARVAVRAQHLLRRSFGVGPDAPFIADSSEARDRDVRHELNRWASKINVPLRLRATRSGNNHWQYRNGVTLTDLKAAVA
jgi:hypothetical protein